MGAFLFFFAHTKIQKNTHIYNFIMLTNVLIIRYIVNNCKNYLSPELTLNLINVKNIAARAAFCVKCLYSNEIWAAMFA